MKKNIFSALVFLSMFVLVACKSSKVAFQNPTEVQTLTANFHGKWQDENVMVSSGLKDSWILNIDSIGGSVTFSTMLYSNEFCPVDWKMETDKLILSMNDKANRLMITLIRSKDGNVLEGIYTQYGERTEVNFVKLSDEPEKGTFSVGSRHPSVSFHGKWQDDNIMVFGRKDSWTLSIDSVGVKFSSTLHKVNSFPVNWQVETDKLILAFNDKANRLIITLIRSKDGNALEGFYAQRGARTDVSFAKLSDETEAGTFSVVDRPSVSFHGKWQNDNVMVSSERKDSWILNIDATEGSVTLSSTLSNVEFLPVDWEMETDKLILSLNDEANRLMITLVSSKDGNALEGIFTQHGATTDVNFVKLSDEPEKGTFSVRGSVSYDERIKDLRDFANFAEDGDKIHFSYDLNRRDLYAGLIERFNLDSITAGHSDVELMVALLNWVCDNFLHDGMSYMPHERDAFALINYLDNNPSGGNCRILAILLAEVLRLYGIEAKHITAYPKEDGEVHVVTHAYSRELRQWILLDPTFRLFLKDESGKYIDIPTLRTIFANGGDIFPNKNAGRNNQPLDLSSYRITMADYLFRFSCGTNFKFGSEDGRTGNPQNMLAPVGYSDDQNVTTHCANAFWATPAL